MFEAIWRALTATVEIHAFVLLIWGIIVGVSLWESYKIRQNRDELHEMLFQASLMAHTAHTVLSEKNAVDEWEDEIESELWSTRGIDTDVNLSAEGVEVEEEPTTD